MPQSAQTFPPEVLTGTSLPKEPKVELTQLHHQARYERGRGFEALQPLIGDDVFTEVQKYLAQLRFKQASFLEVGCGKGALCSEISNRYHALKVQGVDLGSPDNAYKGSWSFHQSDALAHLRACKIAGKTFDLIMCIEVAPYIPDQLALIDLIYECLVPGGMAVVTTHPFYFGNQYNNLFPNTDSDIHWVPDRDALIIRKPAFGTMPRTPWKNFTTLPLLEKFLNPDQAGYLFGLWNNLAKELCWGVYYTYMRGEFQRHPFQLSLPTIVIDAHSQKALTVEDIERIIQTSWSGLENTLRNRQAIGYDPHQDYSHFHPSPNPCCTLL